MTIDAGQKTDLEPLLLRTTYFSRPVERAEPPTVVNLPIATAALAQTTELFVAADRLAQQEPSYLMQRTRGLLDSWRDEAVFSRHPYAVSVELVSIEMRSPLVIDVTLPWFALKAGGFVGYVLWLGERICTFRPRVARKRKKDLLMAAAFDRFRTRIDQGRADALAAELIKDGLGNRPDHMDFLDPTDPDDDELEPVKTQT